MLLNGVLPIFAIIGLGAVLKRFSLTDDSFFKTSDRLIYYIFFPVMLFWKIATAGSDEVLDVRLIAAVLCALFCLFLVSLLYVKIGRVTDYEAGSFVQSCFRFNTYVGIAVIAGVLGEAELSRFGVLIGFAIPFISVLSVLALIWYSGKSYPTAQKTRMLVMAMISNPLIIACLLGIAFSRFGIALPGFVEGTFSLMSAVTVPLALMSIGGSLAFEQLRRHLALSMVAAVLKLAVLPVVGFLILTLFGVGEMSFKVAMIYFALPTSPAIYILSSQLNSDVDLASAAIVSSTLLSMISLSATIVLVGG